MDKDTNKTQSPIYKALTAPYTEVPKGFQIKIGIFFYNKDFDSLIEDYLKDFSKVNVPGERIKDLKFRYKTVYPAYKEIIDRAIKGEEPTRGDLKLLKDAFSKVWIDVKRENSHYFPLIYPKYDNPLDVLIQWAYWVWLEKIRVRYCKARDCDRIFIPSRSDQEYCLQRCAKRIWAQKHLFKD